MAGKLNLEIKVGIFAFIGLIILALAVFSISEVYIFRPGYIIKVYFSFAGGLDVGASVRVAGLEAGEVQDIELSYDEDKSQSKVILHVWLNKDVRLPQDSSAFVNIVGLIGESYLEIIPGEDYANLIKEGQTLIGRDAFSTETLMEVVQQAADNLDVTLNSINEVLDTQTKADLKKMIHNLSEFSGSLNESLDDDTKVALKETIQNFRDLSASIKVITGRLERGEGKLGAWLKPRTSRKKKTKK